MRGLLAEWMQPTTRATMLNSLQQLRAAGALGDWDEVVRVGEDLRGQFAGEFDRAYVAFLLAAPAEGEA